MICPICKIKTATIHITDIHITDTASPEKPLHLCNNCKEDLSTIELYCKNLKSLKEKPREIKGIQPSSLKHLSIFKNDESIKKLLMSEEVTCSNCGSTSQDFFANGHLGCEKDYDLFHSVISQILVTLNGTSKHVGKKCTKTPQDKVMLKINTLEYNLQIAIKEEQYELAGKMTKEIQSLKDSYAN